MHQQRIIAWVLLVLSVILGIISFCVLPDTVVTQFSIGGSGVSTMPKFFAVALPTALGVGGALMTILSKSQEPGKVKSLFVSAIGIVVFAFMLIVNL